MAHMELVRWGGGFFGFLVSLFIHNFKKVEITYVRNMTDVT